MKSKSTLNSIMKHSNAEYTNKLFVTFDLQSFFLWQKQKNKNKKMKALFYSVVLKDHLYISVLFGHSYIIYFIIYCCLTKTIVSLTEIIIHGILLFIEPVSKMP